MEISLKMNNTYKVKDIFPMFNIPNNGKNKWKVSHQLKIKASMQTNEKSNNFYEVLSLCSENNVGINEIKKAYRCMALQYHPDVCNHSNKEDSTRRFIELQKAYETLSDPILRENYDYELSLRDYSKGTFGRKCIENSRVVHKDVWERQINGLRRKSINRMKKNRNN